MQGVFMGNETPRIKSRAILRTSRISEAAGLLESADEYKQYKPGMVEITQDNMGPHTQKLAKTKHFIENLSSFYTTGK